jgi:hypothetical protein
MKTFLAQYRHDNRQWGLQFEAESFEDAEARLLSMAETLMIDGVLLEKVDVAEVVAGRVLQ